MSIAAFQGVEPSVGKNLTVHSVQVRAVIAPIEAPLLTAAGLLLNAPLLLIDIRTNEEVVGRAYLIAYNQIVLKALEVIVSELGGLLVGEAMVPTTINMKLQKCFTFVGGCRGLVGMAISGIDLAVWDALGVAANLPLTTLLGGEPRALKAYDSHGLIPAHAAAEHTDRSLKSGFSALKFKLGVSTLEDDVAIVRAFRKAAPEGFEIMADYNQALSVDEALRRCRKLDNEGLSWIEEPVRCDDFEGCASVAAAIETPVQIGENFFGLSDMNNALSNNACDLIMPDVQMIGGVTGWLAAAAAAEISGKQVSSHLFVEASAHLLAVTPTCHWLEFLDLAGGILSEPPRVVGGTVTASERPGIGLLWDEAAVNKYRA